MTQVSKRLVSKDVEERIFAIFIDCLVQVKTSSDVQKFIDDLLSPVEQTMLAKRLSIAFMLAKGYDHRTIGKTLRVSTTTVNKINWVLKNKGVGFRKVINTIVSKEQFDSFWQKIDDTLTSVLPPGKGTNWSTERRNQWNDKYNRQKAF
jgi:uncharacterized protein YerC